MNIIGANITLRAIEKNDLPLLHKWSNNPEIQYMIGGWHFPSSLSIMEEWHNRISKDELNIRFAIDHNEYGFIGLANIVQINWKDKNAFHGILLGDKDIRGKGIGFDVVSTVMKFSFEELSLNRLDTSIIEYNQPSLKLYTEKCNWKVEGIARNWYFRKNRYWDKIIVGCTIDDYNEFKLIRSNGKNN